MSMKKFLVFLLLFASLLLTACGKKESAPQEVDVDLSSLGGAIVFGKIYDMMNNSEKYEGQVIRMAGTVNEIRITQKGVLVDTLYSCFVTDAEGCCPQGIEFVMAEGHEYPPLGEKVVVEGVWNNYSLYGLSRARLINAKIKK